MRRNATNELCMSYVCSIQGSELSSQQLNRGFQFNTMIFGKAERRAANFPVLSFALRGIERDASSRNFGSCREDRTEGVQ
jgi:hypothetical protein